MQKEEVLKKLFELLQNDLSFYSAMIKEVSNDILKEGYSKYPVFVAHQHEVKLGEPILLKEDYARDFSINATTLEDLIEKKIVLAENEDLFKSNYKNPKEFMCVLLITFAEAHFIFAPYKIKPNINASA